MSERAPQLLVNDIIESAEKIIQYTSGMTYAQFIEDDKTVDAVIRNFEVIGEAANRLPDDFKETHDDIDWFKIRGFRNRIVHHYFGIDFEIVWQIKETYLLEILQKLKTIIC